MLNRMTAAERTAEGQPHSLDPGASADIVRAHLPPEDRPQFDLELGEVAEDTGRRRDRVEHWRHVVVIQSDREAFAAIVRRAAERNTGEPNPEGESLEDTRTKAGM